MKIQFLSVLLLFAGCSTSKINEVDAKKKTEVENTVSLKYGAFWDLLSGQKIIIHLTSVDNRSPLKIPLKTGLEKRAVPVGHWELVGFEVNGRKYASTGTSRKYILNMKPNADIYAGSLIVECPVVSNKYYSLLKKMKFFNRYNFSMGEGNCEIVIGNDFDRVRSSLIDSSKSKKLNLRLGL